MTLTEAEPKVKDKKTSLLVAAYGTLRLHQGNWRALLDGKSKHLGTIKTKPEYTMYGKYSGFPIVVDNGTTSIEVDIFRVKNEETLQRLHGLEGCTGIPGHPRNWYDIKTIETPFGEAWIYYQHGEKGTKESIIKSGNWLARHAEKEEKAS